MSNSKTNDNHYEENDSDDISINDDDSYSSDSTYEAASESSDNSLNDFVVDDEKDMYDIDGNIIIGSTADEEKEIEAMKEFREIVAELRKPKLQLNPYPTYNKNWIETEQKDIPKGLSEKERVTWLIKNKLGPNMTLEDYIKYLEEQEKDIVDSYVANKKRRKD